MGKIGSQRSDELVRRSTLSLAADQFERAQPKSILRCSFSTSCTLIFLPTSPSRPAFDASNCSFWMSICCQRFFYSLSPLVIVEARCRRLELRQHTLLVLAPLPHSRRDHFFPPARSTSFKMLYR